MSEAIEPMPLPIPLPRAIGRSATSALAVVGVTDLHGLTAWTRRDVLALHGVGPKAVGILDDLLARHGLDWTPTPPLLTLNAR